MKRQREADLDSFECALPLEMLQEIAGHADCVTVDLLANTCTRLYTEITRTHFDLPPFLDALASAHMSILRDAKSFLYDLHPKDMKRFLYSLGRARPDKKELYMIFPYFPCLDMFIQGYYLAGKTRRIGLEAVRIKDSLGFYELFRGCGLRYHDIDDLIAEQSSPAYKHFVDFIIVMLRSIIEFNARNTEESGGDIFDFFMHLAVIKNTDISLMHARQYDIKGDFPIAVQLLVQVLLEYDHWAIGIMTTLGRSTWTDDVKKQYKEEVAFREENKK